MSTLSVPRSSVESGISVYVCAGLLSLGTRPSYDLVTKYPGYRVRTWSHCTVSVLEDKKNSLIK